MKSESLKKLQDAAAILEYTVTDMSNAGEDINIALAAIRAAIFMETPETSMKFNLYDFVSDDQTRPAMCCVHYEDGFKVASDARVLVAVKSEYDENMEGQNIQKDGTAYVSRYPKWQALFSDKQMEASGFRIDFDKLSVWKKEMTAEKKLKGRYNARRGFVKVGDAFFNFDILFRMAKFMKAIGTNVLHVEAYNRAAACFSEDGSKGLIMPQTYCGFNCGRDESLANLWLKQDDRVMIWEMA